MESPQRTYIAIDLKSFYASVECVERGLDPLNTNLVVADASRTEKTICLAVSPSLKAYGISGRARLFEVVQRVREVNLKRLDNTEFFTFEGKSVIASELKEHPDWQLDYIVAPPRMAYYIDYSTRVYQCYLKYVAHSDIFPYSVDEVFIDATQYLDLYHVTAHELARRMISEVLQTTGVTATAGIGTNMFLAKVAMDVVAKHIPADEDGVRIAALDEMSFREKLWDHRPITDIWRIGPGIARRLFSLGVETLGQLARLSLTNEEILYKTFGINAELIIDHAWGWEPTTMKEVKEYRPSSNSLSSGQVLQNPYDFKKARTVLHEMADSMALQLFERHVVCDQIGLYVGYDVESLTNPAIASRYKGDIGANHYGKMVPRPANGTVRLKRPSASQTDISQAALALFDQIVNPILLIRRLTIAANNLIDEKETPPPPPQQLDLFTSYEEVQRQQQAEKEAHERERKVQQALLDIKNKFGKNAILKGFNFDEGATAKDRNKQIGGHKA